MGLGKEKARVKRCDAYCAGCVFRKAFGGGDGKLYYCDYLCMTGRLRGCPAGKGCDKWEEKHMSARREVRANGG